MLQYQGLYKVALVTIICYNLHKDNCTRTTIAQGCMMGKEMTRWPPYIARACTSTKSGESSGGLEEHTNGCFSTIRNTMKHIPNGSSTAPTAVSALSAWSLMRLRSR